MRNKLFLEYVWLDGYETPNLRSKVKVVDHNRHVRPLTIEHVPEWNFDGSSTMQAEGSKSECILDPVRLYQTDASDVVYVLCQVRNADESYHDSNTRIKLAVSKLSSQSELPGENEHGYWWGFEQEYFITDGYRPIGFPAGVYPNPQGQYYCGVGGSNVNHRDLAMDHMYECLDRGIEITGINAEVALSQWEYQVFSKDTLKACDDLWMSRYLLHRLAEQHGVSIDMTPKPLKGDWNGSGCHTNFSNSAMRTGESEKYFTLYLASLEASHDLHIRNYGAKNNERLTGEHETQHIGKFSYGVGDRGASIRIPNSVVKNNWCGYLEDRRPAANCDPYKVAQLIIEASP